MGLMKGGVGSASSCEEPAAASELMEVENILAGRTEVERVGATWLVA